ncbi:dihydromonapterin reductase [Stutzerimonas zhaodongensis]|uniref:dihydromonapterin reductase n=1 Tax=Stutzerimonas TaxID=2901164 RepID=UPI00388ED145
MNSPILITGTSKRVGHALVRSLVDAGHEVITVNRSIADGHHNGALNFQADLASREDRIELIEKLRTTVSSLRGVIHNASLWLDDSLENLDYLFRIHVEAPFHLNTELAGLLSQAPRGDIIHICDESASRGSKSHIAYAATKAALQNMTLSFAATLAPNIRVNSVSPGLLIFKEDGDELYKQETLAKAVLPYEPGFQPLLDAVQFLLASTYTTGSNIVVNGGRHLKRS